MVCMLGMDWVNKICLLYPRLQLICSPFSLLQLAQTTKVLNQRYKELPQLSTFKFRSQPCIQDFVVLFKTYSSEEYLTDTNEQDTPAQIQDSNSLTVDLNQLQLSLTKSFQIEASIRISNGKIQCNNRAIYLVSRNVLFENIHFEGVVMFETHGNSNLSFVNCSFREVYFHPADQTCIKLSDCLINGKLFVMSINNSHFCINNCKIVLLNDNFQIQVQDQSNFEMAGCDVEMRNNSLIGMVCRFAGLKIDIVRNQFRYFGGWSFEFVNQIWNSNDWQRVFKWG
eukprot:TRINITY_DN20823_c0_g2_i1.p1 TRINITY_DN20823_c0_g2~~TRINITY_DN20823_c0_g2_i1.p1  ORF type:complete len:283 (-),score=8.84 TRINITY_DN20823_c0_g2_i1:336-1184(-)